jgi:hypothetical protein
MRDSRINFLSLIFTTASVLSLTCGCSNKPQTTLSGADTPQLSVKSQEEARRVLDDFEIYLKYLEDKVNLQIDSSSPEFRNQKKFIMFRVRMRQAFNTMIDKPNVIISIIETWALLVRTSDFFESGEGSDFYGQYQQVVVDNYKKVTDRYDEMVKSLFSEDVYKDTKEKVYRFARQNPINKSASNLIMYATESKPGEKSPFERVLAIPLSPFRAMEGVDKTAIAINNVSEAAQSFNETVRDMPENTRWQLLLLLMELENIDTVKRALNSIEGVSQSSDKLAKTAAELPASIKKEAESLLQSLDEKQENIQQTLKQAETTVDIALRVTENVKSITQTLAGTSQEYSDAAIEFRNTADAVTETVQTIRAFLEARDLASKDKPHSDITVRDYNEAARNITAAAAELRAGINELNETINNRQAVAQIIDHTSDQSRQLVNHIAKIAAMLIFLAFSLSVIFLIIKRKLTPKNA